MCRNIKTLFNFEPPATEDEIRASALQFVRKLSGFNRPSDANAAAFDLAVEEVSEAARKLLASLHTPCARAGPRGGGREGSRQGARAVRLGGAGRPAGAPRLPARSRPASAEQVLRDARRR